MDRSPEVMWALTKKSNNQLVKFQGRHWTKSPFSMSGRWNASEAAKTVGVSGRKEGNKTIYTLSLKTKSKNGISKRAQAGSQRQPGSSVCDIRCGRGRAAKAIQSLTYQNSRDKTLALSKLRRLARANGANSKGAALKLATKTKKKSAE